MLSPERIEGEEPNPFEGFSAAEVIGFIHRKGGEAALRETLNVVDGLTLEFLEGAASELEEAGLSKPAAIVREIATGMPSEFDVNNPYDPGSTNWHYWRQSWVRRQKIRSGELEAGIRQRHHRNKRKH